MRKLLCLLGYFICTIIPSIKSQNNVVISEIMYDTPLNEFIATSYNYSNGEFIELYNIGDSDVNMTGWTLNGGGVTEIYDFPSNTILPSKSHLIVAFKHQYGDFLFHDLYEGITQEYPNKQILYQRKIILSNSGESVVLKDNNGITKDSIYYDGTSNKKKPDRLEALNQDNIEGLSCVSLQRVFVQFNMEGQAYTYNSEWVTDIVTPFEHHYSFIDPIDDSSFGSSILYYYDESGNIISRQTIFLRQNLRKKESQEDYFVNDEIKLYNDQLLNINLYPNPTHGIVYIEIPNYENFNNVNIYIYDLTGKLILNRNVENSITEIDFSKYPNGTYILKLNKNGIMSEWKIIKN